MYKSIHEYRLTRLKEILENDLNNNRGELASRIDVSVNFISKILTRKANIGDNLARKIENEFQLEPYIFDQPVKDSYNDDTKKLEQLASMLRGILEKH